MGAVFGRLAGFELGWIYYVARATAFAANLNVLISYLARWWVGADGGVARIALMLAFVAGFAAVNIVGSPVGHARARRPDSPEDRSACAGGGRSTR